MSEVRSETEKADIVRGPRGWPLGMTSPVREHGAGLHLTSGAQTLVTLDTFTAHLFGPRGSNVVEAEVQMDKRSAP